MGRNEPNLSPRLVCREIAAAYIGVSPNTFDKMVAAGSMPKPRRLTEGRIAWDMQQLNLAVDRLPVDGDDGPLSDGRDQSWDDIDAQTQSKPAIR
jgi:predicted DNA-binding transcriptional regulator AlpA